jgi:adenylylsulfate kinase-like enzyme
MTLVRGAVEPAVTKANPVLWLIAGPSGAGKTTITKTLPATTRINSLRSLNPDEITRELLLERGGWTFQTARPIY